MPSNATLVIVGDVDTEDVLKKVAMQFGAIAPGVPPARVRQVEPEQQAERRVVLRKEGTTAYWKAAFHAPSFEDEAFFPLLVADAVLNGAGGLNIWSGACVPPQRARVCIAHSSTRARQRQRGLLPRSIRTLRHYAGVAEGRRSGGRGVRAREIDVCVRGHHPEELRRPTPIARAIVYDGDQRDRQAPRSLFRDDRIVGAYTRSESSGRGHYRTGQAAR